MVLEYGCLYSSAKAWCWSMHAYIQVLRHGAGVCMPIFKCYGMVLEYACLYSSAKAWCWSMHAYIQVLRHGAGVWMPIFKC